MEKKIIWHETNMTSNTTPSPYIASGKDVYNSNYDYWKAFNNTTTDWSDSWTSLTLPSYIQIDYGAKKNVDFVKIRTWSSPTGNDANPKIFEVLGSDDGSNWETILNKASISGWLINEEKTFELDKPSNFRYYRVLITESTGQTYISIGWIKFGRYKIERNFVLKNTITNRHYSLSHNTLIHLPDNSPKNMILHGIKQGKEIQLNMPFTKFNYVNGAPVSGVSKKVFTQDTGRINNLNIREIKEDNFKPIYTWHNTNMTSNTSPSPLVASASSTVSATYPAYKAFNGTNSSNTDGWASNGVQANITINYGLKKKINIVRVSASMTSGGAIPLSAPKDFIIKGSKDGITFHDIVTIENQTNWTSAETREFEFGIDTEYQIYVLDTLSNNGNSNTIIGEILYGYKREVN